MNQEELLKKAKSNLPDSYLQAISEAGLPQRIEKIGKQNDLSEEQIDVLDQEVMYLVLYITDPADFTERLAEGLEIDGDDLLQVINNVTDKVLTPLKTLVNAGTEEESPRPSLDIPVPPPPSGDTPSPSYGGTSDPYREPTDD